MLCRLMLHCFVYYYYLNRNHLSIESTKKILLESFANNPCHEELIYTLSQKKIVHQNEFLEFLKNSYKILDSYTSINFRSSVKISRKSNEYSQIIVSLKYRGIKNRCRRFFKSCKTVNTT